MTTPTTIVIGTRGSELALAQTRLVEMALLERHPGLAIETKVITTKGDVNLSPIPVGSVGKAWFTAEIEQALLDGAIDIAVHSLKDLPPELLAGTVALPVLERGNPSDVLISKTGRGLAALPAAAVIGTDSLRRKALLLSSRPDVDVKSIRGNVPTRLKKLHAENFDAIVLAAAGLERLGLDGAVTERFDPTRFLPAPGQGILVAQALAARTELVALLAMVQDPSTVAAAEAELAFARAVGGGCKLPVGCYARVAGGTITIDGMVGSDSVRRASTSGPVGDAVALAERLAASLL